MGLFGKKKDESDDEEWTTACHRCGGTAVSSNYCSDACRTAAWEEQEQRASWSRLFGGSTNTNPNCPACGGSGSCKLCEDD